MWGMIAKIRTIAGKREELVAILHESAAEMPGCLSYVVAHDPADPDILWVTEAWDSQASHDASLSLRQIQDVIPRAKAIVANFEKIAVTTPVWGVGIRN